MGEGVRVLFSPFPVRSQGHEDARGKGRQGEEKREAEGGRAIPTGQTGMPSPGDTAIGAPPAPQHHTVQHAAQYALWTN